MILARRRKLILEWIRKQLIGPAEGQDQLVGISPLNRYPCGILYPVVPGEDGEDSASLPRESEANDSEAEEAEAEAEGSESEGGTPKTAKPIVSKIRYIPPSSVGFSFFVRGEGIRLRVTASASRYRVSEDKRDARGQYVAGAFPRLELPEWEEPFDAPIGATSPHLERRLIWPFNSVAEPAGVAGQGVQSHRAGIDALWRPFADGWIVTITLFNRERVLYKGDQKAYRSDHLEKCLFETKLECLVDSGEVGNYPRVDRSLLDFEEEELELQYRHKVIYAVGHGAAAEWDGRLPIQRIRSEFLPWVEVPRVTADGNRAIAPILELSSLATASQNPEKVFDNLDRFIADYENWVKDREVEGGSLSPEEQPPVHRINAGMTIALKRMKHGLHRLRVDSLAREAFSIANQAMLDQMVQHDKMLGRSKPSGQYRWRPFQLAFLLTVLESVLNEQSDFRDIVDLIWFPTGGGKTEAYLGLIAFLIAWRRLKYHTSGAGTTVLMRYTLRLLTADQYRRATRLICALELQRRRDQRLGEAPISIGMWVGLATSPNTFRSAKKLVESASTRDGKPPMELILVECPWCKTVFKSPDNYDARLNDFHFRCLNSECAFSEGTGYLPCNVVDEALFQDPPTLLVATIDKFTRLAWDDRTTSLLGGNGTRPPELVIQDELHLIAGALGSVAGIYEAALDSVLKLRGVYPKYVASTATIRMATDQVKRLYGRELAIFPPREISAEDTYFARIVPLDTSPGRIYVGYLAPRLGRQKCMAPLTASLLLAPLALATEQSLQNPDGLFDAWWTQVVYHGSLKGVGNSHNAFNIDVRERLYRLSEELNLVQNEQNSVLLRERPMPVIAQLTSTSAAETNAATFRRLEDNRGMPGCIDAVLATNMISVGLDVERLALMVINGQPLTTAEYIQASSRVGRGEVPGLVFANYYRDQARSLSHYENFRPYHESFYRFVEPSSVTPYTYQARMRALHAALVITVRHTCSNMLANETAATFDPNDPLIAKAIEMLKNRCAQADPDRSDKIRSHIDRLVEEWYSEVNQCKDRRALHYQADDDDASSNRLLFNHGDRIRGLWPTLQSMRNVENTALLKQL